MGLDALLSDLERRPDVTSVTPRNLAEVTPKTLNLNAVTSVTSVTPKNDNVEGQADPEARPEWLVTLPTGERFTCCCTPPATLAEVRTWYPDALSIEADPGDPGELAPEAILEPAGPVTVTGDTGEAPT